MATGGPDLHNIIKEAGIVTIYKPKVDMVRFKAAILHPLTTSSGSHGATSG